MAKISPQPPPLPGNDELSARLSGMRYPLRLSFALLTVIHQEATVTDVFGKTVLYIEKKGFKLREHVQVFDNTRTSSLADIHANKVIDWSARYSFTDASAQPIGSVGRKGWRSIWRAHYETFKPGADTPDFFIREENSWTKVMDSILGGIPILGMLTGYLFHPKYLATRTSAEPVMRLTKQAALWEGRFGIEKLGDLSPREELNLILSFIMLVMLERGRG